MNERAHFLIKIYLSHFIHERGCFLCVRSELETGTDCYILTPSSSDRSSTSFAFWLSCSTVGHWGPNSSVWSWFSLHWHPISNWNWLTQAVCGTWLYNCLTFISFLWAYASATITKFNHVHRSRWYSDIFDQMHQFRCSSAYLHRCISWLTARSRVNMLDSLFVQNDCERALLQGHCQSTGWWSYHHFQNYLISKPVFF